MARNNKPIKIKRYKNSMGGGSNISFKLRKLVPLVLAIALIVGAGFLLGKPILAFLENASGGGASSQVISQSEKPVSQPVKDKEETPVSSEIVSSTPVEEQPVVPPVVAKTRVYFYANTASLTTEAGIDGVISQMKTKGATHLVFDLKKPDGDVNYVSANQYASQLASNKMIDVKLLVSKLADNGITPVARIYTFMDKLISTVERSTAVMYLGTDTRWLDSSAALGGKAWANPASSIMQQYIIDITDEVLSMGVKEIIYAGFHTPTGYSLDKRDFGATQDQVLANMKNLAGTLKAKISAKGGYSCWQVEYSAVMPEGNYAQYIIHPYQLGFENIIITGKGAEMDSAQVVPALETASQAEEMSSITLWLTDNVNTDPTKTLGDYFVA